MWQEVIHILNTFMKNLALEIGNPYLKIRRVRSREIKLIKFILKNRVFCTNHLEATN